MRALDRALVRLQAMMQLEQYRTLGRLPPLVECAKLAGVSRNTMSRAVALLASQGTIKPVAGRGLLLFPAPSQPSIPSSVRPASAIHFIKKQILRDIAQGVMRPGRPLPSYRELGIRYGASIRTTRLAVLELAPEVGLIPSGRGYALPVNQLHGRSVVVLLYPRYTQVKRGQLFSAPRLETLAHLLEKRGRDSNFGIEAIQYAGAIAPKRYHHFSVGEMGLEKLEKTESVLGYVLWHIPEYERRHQLLEWLRKTKKPVAIVDDNGDLPLESLPSPWKGVRIFHPASSRIASIRLAQYLLRLGHRHIAYFSLFHHLAWSIRRYETIREAFKGSDFENSVTCFPGPERSSSEFEAVRAACTRHFVSSKVLYSLDYLRPATTGRMAQLIGQLFDLLVPLTDDNSLEPLNRLFDRALANRKITAWVCANDEIGLYALRFLRSKSIAVPHDISVVGFDNTLEGFSEKLTSYDFDLEVLAQQLLDHILWPSRSTTQPLIIESEGMVVERGSVGSARRG